MAVDPHDIASLIRQVIPEASVTLTDLRGDGTQYAACVVSPVFAGKTRLEQHRMVYQALRGKSEDELHALSIQTAEK